MGEVGKKDFIIKICCLIASFCLWIYISIINNPIKTVVVKNIQVELVNTDTIKASQLIVSPNQDLTVNLTVKCNANKIIDLKAGNFKITADLNYYAVKKGENRIPVQVVDSPQGVSVVKDENLWVDVDVDSLESKIFPIQSKLEGKPQEGMYLNNPTINPSEAEVSGPSSYLSKVEKVIVFGNVNNFTSSNVVSLPLMAVDKSGNEIKEVSLTPKSANVTLVMSKIKTVPIKVELQGTVAHDYILDSIENSMENVQITGDDSVLNNITSISTEGINIDNLSENKEVDTKIVLPPGILLVNSKDSVNVKINVDKVESKIISCDIKAINLDNNYNYSFETNTINITISGGSKKLSNITDKDISANVDLKNYGEGTVKLPINISVPPEFVVTSKSLDETMVTISKK